MVPRFCVPGWCLSLLCCLRNRDHNCHVMALCRTPQKVGRSKSVDRRSIGAKQHHPNQIIDEIIKAQKSTNPESQTMTVDPRRRVSRGWEKDDGIWGKGGEDVRDAQVQVECSVA